MILRSVVGGNWKSAEAMERLKLPPKPCIKARKHSSCLRENPILAAGP
jgi:hypothetical protein